MIEDVISRLDKVKSTGKNRWIAKCPSHQDKSPSLAISVADDGVVLMNCFAGCGSYEILQSIGLDWDALFPEKNLGEHKPKKSKIYATEGMHLLRHESQIIVATGIAMRNNTITTNDLERAIEAMKRINEVYEACGL